MKTGQRPMWIVVGALLFLLSFSPSTSASSAQGGNTSHDTSRERGGIRGRIVDAGSGRPVSGATVEVSDRGGLASASTGADGRYEVRGLKPGEYRVYAHAAGYVARHYGQRESGEEGTAVIVRRGQIGRAVDVRLQQAAAFSGRIFSDSGEGLAGVEIEVLARRYRPGGVVPAPVAFAQSAALGVFRVVDLSPGEYYVRAHVSTAVRPSRVEAAQVYATTYFPRVTSFDDAQPIVLAAGQELFDVDFSLATVTTATVSGTLVDITGRAVDRSSVVLLARGGARRYVQQAGPKGRFEIRDVLPGEYTLSVSDGEDPVRWMAAIRQIVVESDVPDVEIVARYGARVEGRFVRDGDDPLPFDPRPIRVGIEQRVESRPGIADMVHRFDRGDGVQADGTFSLESPGGLSSLEVSDLPSGWTVKAIRLEGADITDRAIDFGEGVRRQVEVVLTHLISHVIGRVTDRSGRGASNYIVVVFPEDPDRWKPPSRLVRGVRPGNDGLFRIADLPPAEYRAVAIESLPQNAWIDPSVLERLWSSSTPFRLNEGEQRTLNLRLSSTPDGLLP